MTTKERLHHLVDELDEAQAAEVLHLINDRFIPSQRAPRRKLPAWVGSFRSKTGETDVSDRADEILRAELSERSE